MKQLANITNRKKFMTKSCMKKPPSHLRRRKSGTVKRAANRLKKSKESYYMKFVRNQLKEQII